MAGPIKTLMVDSLRIRVYANPDSLLQEAAREIFSFLKDAMLAQDAANVIVARSSAQLRLLDHLAHFSGVSWSKVTLFHTEEFLGLSADHPGSCARFMREKVESKMHPRAFHYLEGNSLQPIKACEHYAQLLRMQKVDLCFAEIGEAGQLGLNGPRVADFADGRSVKIVQVDDAVRQELVNAGFFPDLAATPSYAFTLTLPALYAARRLLCLAMGVETAQAIKEVLQGPIRPECPASGLRKQANAILLIDADAASLL